MKCKRLLTFGLLISLFAPIYMVFYGTGVVQAAGNSCGGWSVVKSPNGPNSDYNFLNGVAGVSGSDVWAVGYTQELSGNEYPLMENWNGSKWTATLGSPEYAVVLQSVTVVPGSTNAWAAGYYTTSGSASWLPLIEYWNGSSWSAVPGPNPYQGQLYGIAAVSANDVWAVGQYTTSSNQVDTLLENWNGTNWTMIPSSVEGQLTGIWAASATDIWAVGYGSGNNQVVPLMEHWDGNSWSVNSGSPVGTGNNFMTAISGSSSSDVWAVGSEEMNKSSIGIYEHWDGASWSVVSAPSGGVFDYLNGVIDVSPTNVWAVGSTFPPHKLKSNTFTEHWNGTSWAVVHSPNSGTKANEFLAVTNVPSTSNMWAVGDIGTRKTLTEYYC